MSPKELAIAMTARGIYRGREYEYNNVRIYPKIEPGIVKFIIEDCDKKQPFKNPQLAARKFVEIQERLKNENSIRHGDSRS